MAQNLFNPNINPKLKAMNKNSLHESMNRDINFALQKKPSLDGLSNIGNTQMEKPFLDMENMKLDISNNLMGNNNLNEIISQQVGNLRNEVLQSNTVAKIINNNGNLQGEIHKIAINSNDRNNFNVKQESMNHKGEEKVIKSFTINLDDMDSNTAWVSTSPTPSVTRDLVPQNNLNLRIQAIRDVKPPSDNTKIVDVVPVIEEDTKLKKSFNDIMNNVHSNKILTFGFLILVIVIIYLIRNQKILGK